MATLTVSNVVIRGIACAVPPLVRSVSDLVSIFGEMESTKISGTVGVSTRHIASDEICTSDLCHAAAERLLAELDWSPESVDLLVFVSQTPDYRIPTTACCLHARLKLHNHCAAFDVNLGCSGYVYGLWMVSQLLSGHGTKRALLLVGDTISRVISPLDRATTPLFGDAGSASALEFSPKGGDLHFVLGTDGTGAENLMIPAGGFRQPITASAVERVTCESGNIRSQADLYMNGAEIFTFTLREVPAMTESLLDAVGWTAEDVDWFVMHQANKFMLDHLVKRMKLPTKKVVLGMAKYGNTSSASIPLALVTELSTALQTDRQKLVLEGFGVGYSWGAVAWHSMPMIVAPLVILPNSGAPRKPLC